MESKSRDRIIELVRQMKGHTINSGCTPGEAAKFAAKVAELIEKYQISDAEMRAKDGAAEDSEVCQNFLRTGKKVFNPGMTAVVNGLATSMCCKTILLNTHGEAIYGIVGDTLDTNYVCQMSITLVSSLRFMAGLEGREHGYEKAGLVRWTNQYLIGAAKEIRYRIEQERKERSDIKLIERQLDVRSADATSITALAIVTGETIAVAKREATEEVFKEFYPKTKTTFSRSGYDHTANERGREAGRIIGLHVCIEEK